MMLQQTMTSRRVQPPCASAQEPDFSALTAGFLPAFRHDGTGQVHLCLLKDGRLSALHVLDSLPATWVAERDPTGRPMALINQVSAGFLRGDHFWSLSDLRSPRLDS